MSWIATSFFIVVSPLKEIFSPIPLTFLNWGLLCACQRATALALLWFSFLVPASVTVSRDSQRSLVRPRYTGHSHTPSLVAQHFEIFPVVHEQQIKLAKKIRRNALVLQQMKSNVHIWTHNMYIRFFIMNRSLANALNALISVLLKIREKKFFH
jgi:hypothetical protein